MSPPEAAVLRALPMTVAQSPSDHVRTHRRRTKGLGGAGRAHAAPAQLSRPKRRLKRGCRRPRHPHQRQRGRERRAPDRCRTNGACNSPRARKNTTSSIAKPTRGYGRTRKKAGAGRFDGPMESALMWTCTPSAQALAPATAHEAPVPAPPRSPQTATRNPAQVEMQMQRQRRQRQGGRGRCQVHRRLINTRYGHIK